MVHCFLSRIVTPGCAVCSSGAPSGYDDTMRTAGNPLQRRCLLSLAALGLVLTVGGCQKTALRADDTRSQFDRYDQARSQRAEPYMQDEFGRRTPNLKARLLVKDE